LQKHQRQGPADSRKPCALTAEDTGFRGRLGGSQRRGRTVLPGPRSQQSAQRAEPAGAGQGRACTDTKNLADESGCKPLIRQDAYFFGVIASLPHIAYFSELTSPFIVLAFLML